MSLIDLNTHEIFFRNATIAFLSLLNEESSIKLKKNGKIEDVDVPFFYNMGADEQFMRDWFFDLPPDCNVPAAEGNYDRVPRGIVTFTSFQVATNFMTNKFIRGNYRQEARDANDVKSSVGHSARLFAIPLQVTYNVEVRVDTLNQMFKVTELFLNRFYANRVMYFQYRGLRIPCQFRFPDSQDENKLYTYEYSAAGQTYNSVKLSVAMQTHFPSFERTSDRLLNNVIQQINFAYINAASGEPIADNGEWVDQTTLPPSAAAGVPVD